MPWKSRFRALHRWFAFAATVPLIVLSVTGALLIFPEQTRRLCAGDPPAIASEGPSLSPSSIIAAVEAELPEGDAIHRLHYPAHPGDLMRVDSEGHQVRIDPFSGEVRRVSTTRGDPAAFLTKLHVNLFAGEVGSWIIGLSAIALMVLCLSGIRLWWPVGRWSISLVTVKRSGNWKRTNYDLHRVFGIVFSGLLLVIALTGATMAFWPPFSAVAYWVTLSGPSEKAEPTEIATVEGVAILSPDRILDLAMRRHPGLEPRRLYLPTGPGKPYRVFLDPPGEHEFRVNEVRMNFDPYEGTLLVEESPETMSRGDRLLRWVLPLHYGTFGGMATKLLYVPTTLSPLLLAATGTLLWWNRRRKQARASTSARSGQRPPVETVAGR